MESVLGRENSMYQAKKKSAGKEQKFRLACLECRVNEWGRDREGQVVAGEVGATL